MGHDGAMEDELEAMEEQGAAKDGEWYGALILLTTDGTPATSCARRRA